MSAHRARVDGSRIGRLAGCASLRRLSREYEHERTVSYDSGAAAAGMLQLPRRLPG